MTPGSTLRKGETNPEHVLEMSRTLLAEKCKSTKVENKKKKQTGFYEPMHYLFITNQPFFPYVHSVTNSTTSMGLCSVIGADA